MQMLVIPFAAREIERLSSSKSSRDKGLPAQSAYEVAYELLQHCQLVVCIEWTPAEFCCLMQGLFIHTVRKSTVIQQVVRQALQQVLPQYL